MRYTFRTLAALALAVAVTGCANSSFHKAVDTNTARATGYQDGFLEQAANDMTAINDCYVNAAGFSAGGKPVGSAAGPVTASPNFAAFQCTLLAQSLRLTNTFLYAFLGKPEMTRVPAAPEEIMQSIAEKGMKFSLMKFGIGQVSAVVNNGQAAAYQVAAQAMAKNPIMIQPSVITGTPEGFGVLQQGGASTVNP